MKQVFISKKGVAVEEVPDPIVSNETVLVSNIFSCISIGTELSSLRSIKEPLYKKVMNRPEVVKKIFHAYANSGYSATKNIIKKKLNQFHELGYSSSGVVEEVGNGVDFVKPGDFVACSGGGIASHAEKILVPKNLLVKLKDKSKICESATVSLGAIALNGVRRADPTIGEIFLVIGLGLIGQLTIQILRSAGIEVFAIEPNVNFVNKAKQNNFDNIFDSFLSLKNYLSSKNITIDFDGAIITASSNSNLILKNTFNLCRKKARVILVGDVGLSIDREDIYEKEIDFKISSSYGPGRYDRNYEIKGNDYPISYVRWTLNRNMQKYIDMVENNQLHIKNLVDLIMPLEKANDLYDLLSKKKRPLSAFFRYQPKNKKKRLTITSQNISLKSSTINCALIGAGSFASEIVIPNILKFKKICNLSFICTKTSLSALNISKNYKIKNISTSYKDSLNSKEIDTVFITTRHNLHFDIVYESIKQNKNIFVEKPLCLTNKQLRSLKKLISSKKKQVLVTGFNRRFSHYTTIMRDFIAKEGRPIFINYNINADKLDSDSWIYSNEGGGRNIGEACHFYDLILFLINKDIKSIKLSSLCFEKSRFHKTDNFYVVFEFDDFSIAKVNYSMMGGDENFKEEIEIRGEKNTLKIFDFKKAILNENHNERLIYFSKKSEKGHEQLIKAFFECIKYGKECMSHESQFKTMDVTFKIEELF